MPLELGPRESSSKNIKNERLTIVYAEMVPSDTKAAPEPSTSDSTDSSESSEITIGSLTSPTESMKMILEEIEDNKQKEFNFGYEPVWRSMSTTDGSKMKTLDYFQSRNIFQLFNLLIGHLLAHTPEDPITFLIDLVDRCLQYRDRGGDPPLLFEDKHILSVYTAMVLADDEELWYEQYATGMNTLGVADFNLLPEDMDQHNETVAKDTFLREAKRALMDQLDRMLGPPQPAGVSEVTMMGSSSEYKERVLETYLYRRGSQNNSESGTSSSASSEQAGNNLHSVDLVKLFEQPRPYGSISPSVASFTAFKSLEL